MLQQLIICVTVTGLWLVCALQPSQMLEHKINFIGARQMCFCLNCG